MPQRFLVNSDHAKLAVARAGKALVEFAFVAPIFFVLVLGIFEFGQAMMVQSLLAGAAQTGARKGALNASLASDVTTAVNSYLSSVGISGATTTVTPDPPSSANPGQSVTVSVSVGFAQISWLPAPAYLQNKTLSSTANALRESGQ